MSEREDGQSYAEGYRAAIDVCISLMSKWFFSRNKDAAACVEEMRAYRKIYE